MLSNTQFSRAKLTFMRWLETNLSKTINLERNNALKLKKKSDAD